MNDLQLYKKIALEVFSRYNGDKNSFELFTLRTFIGNINNERTKNKKDAQEEFKSVKKNVKSEALKEIVKDLEQAIFGDDDNDESLIEGLDKDKLEQEELDRRFKNLIGKKRRESLREYLKESKDVHPQGRVNASKEYLKKSKDANLQGRANVLKKKLNNSFKEISKDNDERKDNNNDNDDSEDNQISNFVDEALKKVSKEIVNDDAKKLSKEIVNDDPKKVSKEIVNDDAKKVSKEIENDDANERTYVYLQGSHFQQNKVIIRNNYNVINIYVVYKFDPIASSRDTTFTIQNALFGAMQITKNSNTSKYDYKGYGICFDEGNQFRHTITEGGFAHTTNARNVFEADMSFSVHAPNRANHIYVMGKEFVQGINDTTIYAEKSFYRNFTDPGKKIYAKFTL